MTRHDSHKGFWWFFARVTLCAIVFFTGVLLLSDWTYGINSTIGWTWTLTNSAFWLGALVYLTLVFIGLSIVTILIMKMSKLLSH